MVMDTAGNWIMDQDDLQGMVVEFEKELAGFFLKWSFMSENVFG